MLIALQGRETRVAYRAKDALAGVEAPSPAAAESCRPSGYW
ncbi:MAG: hypothetical protein ACREV7_00930 [Steroidobacteraceae bacterium]